MKSSVVLFILLIVLLLGIFVWRFVPYKNTSQVSLVAGDMDTKQTVFPTPTPNPLSIQAMRARTYPGSEFTVIQTLPPGSNYTRQLVSYQSDGLKINGVLTIPVGQMPEGGWPAIVFNHGYIPPEVYRPTERYIAYVDSFARSGFILFRPDYRGHADSEGDPEGAYFAPGYTVDVLNAFTSVQKMKQVNPKRIGLWGHSMGGFITQKAMVINPEIKAGVIWGGVVGTYADMYQYWWSKRSPNPNETPSNFVPSQREQNARRPNRQQFVEQYGQPAEGNPFWDEVSAVHFIKDISGPIQIHHATADETVPYDLSVKLDEYLTKEGKPHEFYTYQGGDHDISDPYFTQAMNRSIEFFKKNL